MVVQIKNCDKIKKILGEQSDLLVQSIITQDPPPPILWVATWFKNVLVFFFLNFRMYSYWIGHI